MHSFGNYSSFLLDTKHIYKRYSDHSVDEFVHFDFCTARLPKLVIFCFLNKNEDTMITVIMKFVHFKFLYDKTAESDFNKYM